MPEKISIKKLLLYGGLTREEYREIEPDIRRRSRATMNLTLIIAVIMLFALTLSSILFPSMTKLHNVYPAFLVQLAAVLLLSYLLKNNDRATFPLLYVFMLLSYIFGIVIGVPFMPDMPATTFCVLIFALPLLITDKPLRVVLLLLSVNIIFCVSTYLYKPWIVAHSDIVNSLCFLFLGSLAAIYVMYSKINDTMNRRYIEKERDTDDLTGLMTKAAASREISRHIAASGAHAALLVLDIDNFKQINDRMGHAYGDAVLRIMGGCIREVFGGDDILSRFGGDEFVLFLPQSGSYEAVCERVSMLVSHMNDSLSFSDNSFTVTGSIGIAFYPQDATSYSELFEKADAALYRSKAKGKNCYTFYLDPDLLGRG